MNQCRDSRIIQHSTTETVIGTYWKILQPKQSLIVTPLPIN